MVRGSLLAKRYAPEVERTWHLSILIGQGVSAWAVHDAENGEPVALAWSTEDHCLGLPEVPSHPRSVSFVSLPEWSTLVPDGALVPGHEADHLALVHGGLPAGALRDEPVRSLGATCIYMHDDRTERRVLERFPNARALPMQGLLVRAAQARCTDRPVLLLHRGLDRLDITVANRGKVLLSNTYPARSGQDTLYFALLATEGCGLAAAETLLHAGGTHLSDGELELLARYFHSSVQACADSWTEDQQGKDLRVDRWLGALEQFPCVS